MYTRERKTGIKFPAARLVASKYKLGFRNAHTNARGKSKRELGGEILRIERWLGLVVEHN